MIRRKMSMAEAKCFCNPLVEHAYDVILKTGAQNVCAPFVFPCPSAIDVFGIRFYHIQQQMSFYGPCPSTERLAVHRIRSLQANLS